MTSFSGFSEEALQLLHELEDNNTREWFQDNKEAYNRLVRDPFADLLDTVTERLESEGGPELRGNAKTMFRVNRDVRFSKDKRPYKTNVSGMLTPSGRKFEAGGLVYAHLEPSRAFLAAGFYRPESDQLKDMRQKIVDNPEAFQSVLSTLTDHKLSLSMESSLSRMPKGFEDQRDHELADYIKLKSYVTTYDLPHEVWVSDKIVDELLQFAEWTDALLKWGR